MKRNLLILGLAIVFLTACAGISLRDNTTQVAIDVSAATTAYLIGQNNPDKIPDWNKWIDKLLSLKAGDSVLTYETLLAKGFELIDKPFIEMQLNKLIRLLEFPELQPPGLPFLKAEYLKLVKVIFSGFRDGLQAAQSETQN